MKQNIEFAPKEYHIICSYDDAILYCFSLNIDGKTGWRLPTKKEYNDYWIISGWYLNDPSNHNLQYATVPVRDIINEI